VEGRRILFLFQSKEKKIGINELNELVYVTEIGSTIMLDISIRLRYFFEVYNWEIYVVKARTQAYMLSN
jgi:hypothetical protein